MAGPEFRLITIYNLFVSDLYKDQDLWKRLSLIEAEFPGSNILLHKLGVLPKVSTLLNKVRLVRDQNS